MLEQVGAVAGAAKIAGPVTAASRFALRRLRLIGTIDMRWLELGDAKGFTAHDVTDIEQFLTERSTKALLSALAMSLLTPHSIAREESLDTLRDMFNNLAQRRHAAHPNKWRDRRAEVWDTIVSLYDRATPAGQELADAALEYEDFLRTPLGSTQATEKRGLANYSRFVERLSEVCSDLNRVAEAIDTAARIKESIVALPTPPIITYMSTSKAATFEDLFVPRTLVNPSGGTKVDGSGLSGDAGPYRAVVHGAPGAGKSTFVRNLRKELAEDAAGQPAVLLNARDYVPSARHQSIVEHLAEDIRASASIEVSDEQLRDTFTLGHALVIFDGIDEITDINQRIEMVQRISAFATEFPAASVLVTSRSIGYDRAPLPPSVFETLTLEEYTPQQTGEYIRRWFGFIERPELESDFLRESEAVADLKKNPLLLSLLCVLYRERGTIPRKRREVYQQCADLLFHTWDSHRHIEQPEELHTNGDRIMQELARWVFKSQAAQNGLSESVIRKAIGVYLRDAAGVEEGEARRRAGEFLEFCATRAWLLGVIGTDHGERVFGFTHRTFFEYFTAEAISRATSDIDEIAKTLVEAHRRDATSVLPELLLQAIDEKVDRGAANTFKRVCEMTDDETLILRLMEGVPLPTPTRSRGFDRVLAIWQTRESIPRAAFIALLSLHVDARNQFVRDYLVGNTSSAADLFLGAWASLDLSRGVGRYELIWEEHLDTVINNIGLLRSWWFSSAAAAWLWRTRRQALDLNPKHLFRTEGTDGPCVGTLWLALELANEGVDDDSVSDVETLFALIVKRARNSKNKVPRLTASTFTDLCLGRTEAHRFPDMQNLEGDGAWVYLYAIAVAYEAAWSEAEVIESLMNENSSAVRYLLARRSASADDDLGVDLGDVSDSDRPSGMPRWLHEWSTGNRAFTEWA